jgi:hypothetical protein
MSTFNEQRKKYHKYTLTIRPEHKGAKDELHMVERNILAFYAQITRNGTEDVIYMSRRVAQSIGLYLPNTKQADVMQSEEVIASLIEREYLMTYKLGKDIMIRYQVKAEPAAPKSSTPLAGTSGLF